MKHGFEGNIYWTVRKQHIAQNYMFLFVILYRIYGLKKTVIVLLQQQIISLTSKC